MNTKNIVPASFPEIVSAPSNKPPSRRILVVEDDGNVRRLNAELLRNSGYEVDTAEDGEAGWQALHAASCSPDSYDLLITDNDMPKVSGLGLLKRLRAARMDLPVIMASGTLTPQEIQHNPWLQPSATLLKPYSVEELLSTVRKVLGANVSPSQEGASTPGRPDPWLADGPPLP
jgi:CheY-like chemotaxis protein